MPSALAKGVAFSVAAGCGSGTGASTAKCLRSLTSAQIEALAGTASANSAYIAGPMVDGTIIPQQPVQAWHNGQFNHMPMMNGRTFDEANFSLGITEYFSSPQAPPTAAQYIAFVNTTYTAPNAYRPVYPTRPAPPRRFSPTIRSRPMPRRSWPGTRSYPIWPTLAPPGTSINYSTLKCRSMDIRSTTGRRRRISRSCRGSCFSPITPATSSICSRFTMAGRPRPASYIL